MKPEFKTCLLCGKQSKRIKKPSYKEVFQTFLEDDSYIDGEAGDGIETLLPLWNRTKAYKCKIHGEFYVIDIPKYLIPFIQYWLRTEKIDYII